MYELIVRCPFSRHITSPSFGRAWYQMVTIDCSKQKQLIYVRCVIVPARYIRFDACNDSGKWLNTVIGRCVNYLQLTHLMWHDVNRRYYRIRYQKAKAFFSVTSFPVQIVDRLHGTDWLGRLHSDRKAQAMNKWIHSIQMTPALSDTLRTNRICPWIWPVRHLVVKAHETVSFHWRPPASILHCHWNGSRHVPVMKSHVLVPSPNTSLVSVQRILTVSVSPDWASRQFWDLDAVRTNRLWKMQRLNYLITGLQHSLRGPHTCIVELWNVLGCG